MEEKLYVSEVSTEWLRENFGTWDKELIVNDEQKHYALTRKSGDTCTPVAFMCVRVFGKYYKVQGIYTVPTERKKGYFTRLCNHVLSKYSDRPVKADCLEASLQYFLCNGFRLVSSRRCKNFTLYKVERK